MCCFIKPTNVSASSFSLCYILFYAFKCLYGFGPTIYGDFICFAMQCSSLCIPTWIDLIKISLAEVLSVVNLAFAGISGVFRYIQHTSTMHTWIYICADIKFQYGFHLLAGMLIMYVLVFVYYFKILVCWISNIHSMKILWEAYRRWKVPNDCDKWIS